MLCPRQFSLLFSMAPLLTCISPFVTSSFHVFPPSTYFATQNTFFTAHLLGFLVHLTTYYQCLHHINATWFTYLSLDYWFLTLMLLLPLPWPWLVFHLLSVLSVASPVLIILFCLALSQANPVDTESSVPSKILTCQNNGQDYSLLLPLNIPTHRSCWHWVMNLQVASIL